jgi:hypothetical protein
MSVGEGWIRKAHHVQHIRRQRRPMSASVTSDQAAKLATANPQRRCSVRAMLALT